MSVVLVAQLPTSLTVSNVEYEIDTDYRTALTILRAFNDDELNNTDKYTLMLYNLLGEEATNNFTEDELVEACKQASWFLDGGEERKTNDSGKKTLDWEQDEKMIISAVNKTAHCEVRAKEYLHWWTFLGHFSEVGECALTNIISIRDKINKGKKLDDWEKEFYDNNKNVVDIKKKFTEEEQEEVNRILDIIKSPAK